MFAEDIPEVITECVLTYEGLYGVLKARLNTNVALDPTNVTAREELNPYVFYGRFHSDWLGQTRRIDPNLLSDEQRALLPPVMSVSRFLEFVNQHIRPEGSQPITVIPHDSNNELNECPLPPPNLPCVHCHLPDWKIDDSHLIKLTLRAYGDYCYCHGHCYEAFSQSEVIGQNGTIEDGLCKLGFTSVSVTDSQLPIHIVEFFLLRSCDQGHDPSTLSQTISGLPYTQVRTDQGQFGIAYDDQVPMIDLSDTGFNIFDLFPDLRDRPNETEQLHQHLLPFNFDQLEMVFQQLLQLLQKRQNQVAY